jgi:ABC-2 type transport system ATP-binding protein
MTRTPHPVVDVRNLTMDYGASEVLRGVTFSVEAGEVVVLLGPNGAGKTTVVEILEGFRRRTGGDVVVLGEDPARAGQDWRGRIGVLQSWRDHRRWRVAELLDHFARCCASVAPPGREPLAVARALALVGLAGHERERIGALSGGQRRRLDVACAIVGRPELLFLDEPTTGFDPHARRDFHDLVHRLTDFDGTTVLLTTHDLAEAEALADRILVLDGGRVLADGSAAELAARIAGHAEVHWTVDGQRHVHATVGDPTAFVRDLLAREPRAANLQVRARTLEDTYLAMVTQQEGADA